jgi:hypothetical protein
MRLLSRSPSGSESSRLPRLTDAISTRFGRHAGGFNLLPRSSSLLGKR